MSQPNSPYKGLMPYEESDAEFFFGRNAQREIIVANLMASRLTLLYGPSGVGKSSVLRAGVAPHLRKIIATEIERRGKQDFTFIVFNAWRDNPVEALRVLIKEQLARSQFAMKGHDEADSQSFDWLGTWSNRINGELYIILDQFEEYFLYNTRNKAGPNNAKHNDNTFGVEFARAVNQPNLRVNFLISIREDSLAKLDQFKGRIPTLFNNYLRINHLSREQARQAIEQPIDRYNALYRPPESPITLDPELTTTVLNQIQTGRLSLGETGGGVVESKAHSDLIETPYLQLVMTRLWDEEISANSRELRLATLQRLGNAERIVRTHLDDTMDALSPGEQEIAARAFHYLVTPSGTKIAYYSKDLAVFTGFPKHQIEPVLERLGTGRVLILRKITDDANSSASPRYEIFHDVLAKPILDWRSRFNITRRFEDNISMHDQQQSQKHQTSLILIFILAAAVVALGMLFGWKYMQVTTGNNISDSLRLTVGAHENYGNEAGILLAKEAFETAKTPESESALREALLQFPIQLTIKTTKSPIKSVVISEDSLLAVLTSNDAAFVWNIRTGLKISEFADFPHALARSAISHDSKLVATANHNGRVHVWNASTGQRVATFTSHTAEVTAVEFSPDNRHVLTASRDSTVIIWDISSNEKKAEFAHTDQVNSAEFSADGESVVTASFDSRAALWHWRTSKPLPLPNDDQVFTAKFSKDGSRIVTANQNNSAIIWDARTVKQLRKLEQFGVTVFDASFSPDAKRVVTADGRGDVRIWNVDDGQEIVKMQQRGSRAQSAVFSPDGSMILSTYADKVALLSDAANGNVLQTLSSATHRVTVASFSPAGEFVITGGNDDIALLQKAKPRIEKEITATGAVEATFNATGTFIFVKGNEADFVIDAYSGEVIKRMPVIGTGPGAISIDGQTVARVRSDGYPVIEDLSSENAPVQLQKSSRATHCLTFSPNSALLATADEDGVLRAWNTRQLEVARFSDLPSDAKVSMIRFSPDGSMIGAAASDRRIRVWDMSTQRLLHTIKVNDEVQDFALTLDQQLAVTYKYEISIFDLTREQLRGEHSISGSEKHGLAYNPQTEILLVWDVNMEICHWRPSDGCTNKFQLTRRSYGDVATFSPDGRSVMMRNGDSMRVYSWERFAPVSMLIKAVGLRVSRPLRSDERDRYVP